MRRFMHKTPSPDLEQSHGTTVRRNESGLLGSLVIQPPRGRLRSVLGRNFKAIRFCL
jgi:hypothetical protein